MKKLKVLNKLEKYNENEIFVKGLNTFSNLEKCEVLYDYKILLSTNVFNVITDIGKDLYELVDSKRINDISDVYYDNDFRLKAHQWIIDNYYPYNDFDKYLFNDGKFAHDILEIYIIFNICNLITSITSRKIKITDTEINNMLKFIKLINFKSLISFPSIEVDNYNLILELLYDPNKITTTNKDLFCNSIKLSLISYVSNKINDNHYIMINTKPVFMNNRFYLYNEASCIIGISYYQLLREIVFSNNKQGFAKCVYCNAPFTKSSNRQLYCYSCIEKGIPKKIRDKRYNKKNENKVKKSTYNKSYYKKKINN